MTHVPNRHWRSAFFAVLALLLALSSVFPTSAAPPVPNSMAALGDSITQATNSGGYGNYPQNSWSTGTSTSFDSFYERFLVQNSAITGKNYNYAVSGAKMANLNSQAANAVAINAEFVTVMMGGNDVCTNSTDPANNYGMTSTTDFTTQLTTAMNTLTANNTNTRRVFLVSIPNVNRLHTLFKNNFWARLIWSAGGVCQSLLASPTSNSTAATTRRAAVASQVVLLNSVLQSVCSQYTNCRYDGNAVYNYVFQSADVTTRDYFHPSITGQKNLANTAYTAYLAAP